MELAHFFGKKGKVFLKRLEDWRVSREISIRIPINNHVHICAFDGGEQLGVVVVIQLLLKKNVVKIRDYTHMFFITKWVWLVANSKGEAY